MYYKQELLRTRWTAAMAGGFMDLVSDVPKSRDAHHESDYGQTYHGTIPNAEAGYCSYRNNRIPVRACPDQSAGVRKTSGIDEGSSVSRVPEVS